MMRDNLSFSPDLPTPTQHFPVILCSTLRKICSNACYIEQEERTESHLPTNKIPFKDFPFFSPAGMASHNRKIISETNQGECLESNHMSSWVWQFLTRKNNFPLHCHRRTFAEPLPRTHQPGSRLCTSLHILYTSRVLSETHLSINHL